MTSVTPGRRPPTPSHAGEGENIVTGDIPLPPELGDHATTRPTRSTASAKRSTGSFEKITRIWPTAVEGALSE